MISDGISDFNNGWLYGDYFKVREVEKFMSISKCFYWRKRVFLLRRGEGKFKFNDLV